MIKKNLQVALRDSRRTMTLQAWGGHRLDDIMGLGRMKALRAQGWCGSTASRAQGGR
jgi:hypothetical protein